MHLLDWGLNLAVDTAVHGAAICMNYKLEALHFVGGTTHRVHLYLAP